MDHDDETVLIATLIVCVICVIIIIMASLIMPSYW